MLKQETILRELKLYSSFAFTMTLTYILQRVTDKILDNREVPLFQQPERKQNWIKPLAWAALSGAMSGVFKMIIRKKKELNQGE